MTALALNCGNSKDRNTVFRMSVELDLSNQGLTLLPDSIGEQSYLEKMDLRWNKISPLPPRLERLERRGCIVFILS